MEAELEKEITLSDAAHELGLSWAATWRLVLTGVLDGRRDASSGRWRVRRSSVQRAKRARGESHLPAA